MTTAPLPGADWNRASARYNTLVSFLRRRAAALPLYLTLGLMVPGLYPVLGQNAVFPLKEIRPGMKGVGRTVFAGSQTEEFQVEILGVMENIGPKQNVILARLSGGPLAHTGVMQGMSGSPVWIGGRLVGAVALAFPYSKDPIAGIRPIEEMLAVAPARAERRVAVRLGESELREVATPVSFSGFSERTLAEFAPRLREWGFEPRQGLSAGSPSAAAPSPRTASPLEPGAMISVQLMSGDLSVGADGTVTSVQGDKVYAFGHRFLALGEAELPFARSEVLALLPSVNTSFKISAAREWLGAITSDRNAAIAGQLGRKPDLVPVNIQVTTSRGPVSYKMDMARHSALAPFLLQMAVFNAIDTTERSFGPATIAVQGEIRFKRGLPAIRLDSLFAGDFSVATPVSLAAATPLATLLEAAVPALDLDRVDLTLQALEAKQQARIENAWLSRREAAPGETVDLTVVFAHENGAESRRTVPYRVPEGVEPGTLYLTVADAPSLNANELRSLYAGGALAGKTPEQMIHTLNRYRSNTSAWLRVWRAEPSFASGPIEMPNLPKSVTLALGRSAAGSSGGAGAGSTLAEREITPPGGTRMAVTGSKLLQLEVKP